MMAGIRMMAGQSRTRSKDGRISICFVIDSLAIIGGAERQLLETVQRLTPTRFDVHVCSFDDSPNLWRLQNSCRVHVYPAGPLYSPITLTTIVRLAHRLRRSQIDIVQGFLPKANLVAALSGALARRPVVVTTRLNTGYWYTANNKRLFRIVNHLTTRVMANSELARAVAASEEQLALERIDVLRQGVDLSVFGAGTGDPAVCARLGVPPDAPAVGIVANLRHVKDLDLFLRAAAVVSHHVPEAVFVIVGTGPLLATLQALASELAIGSRVFFANGSGTVPDYLRRMSVACLSSQSEGFSNALLEYMAAGLPVVATDVGGNREAIVDGVTGLLVKDRSPEAFAKPIIHLLKNPGLRSTMGAAGFRRCQETFDIHVTIAELEHYYISLVQGHHWYPQELTRSKGKAASA